MVKIIQNTRKKRIIKTSKHSKGKHSTYFCAVHWSYVFYQVIDEIQPSTRLCTSGCIIISIKRYRSAGAATYCCCCCYGRYTAAATAAAMVATAAMVAATTVARLLPCMAAATNMLCCCRRCRHSNSKKNKHLKTVDPTKKTWPKRRHR